MNVQASLNQLSHGVAPSLQQEGRAPRFVLDDAVSSKVELEAMPEPLRELLDDLASMVLDAENRRVIITGGRFTGKTFLLEQLVHNIESYRGRTKAERIHFIRISEVEMMSFGDHRGLETHTRWLADHLKTRLENICFVTESMDIALYLHTMVPRARIILEINSEALDAVAQTPQSLTSKMWDSWRPLNASAICCTLEEMTTILSLTAMKRLNDTYTTPLTEAQVRSFLKAAVKEYPMLQEMVDKKAAFVVPPAIMAVALQRLAANLAYTSADRYKTASGNPSHAKMVKKTLAEMEELFEDTLSGEGDEAKILNAITEEIEAVIGAQKRQQNPPKAPVAPFVFKDVKSLEERLKKSIFGEDEAVERVARGMVVPAAGLNNAERPIRSLLFLGPTGVGKTQLSLDLAKTVAKAPLHVVRIDMSEYQESHEVAKLFGAPPGYLGFDAGGLLTSAVEEHPHSLILLDEIEKAHPKVWDAFLQVLDSGRMTDSRGKVVDFTKTIVIMTSNIGAQEAGRLRAGFGMGSEEERHAQRLKESELIVKRELQQRLRPELINRLDDIIIFKELARSTALAIVEREVGLLQERMKPKGYSLKVLDREVFDAVLKKADIERYGAREIQRVVFKTISSPVAELMVDAPNGGVIHLSAAPSDEILVARGDQKEEKA